MSATNKPTSGTMNVFDFGRMKSEGRKISMVTCYDYAMARVVEQSDA